MSQSTTDGRAKSSQESARGTMQEENAQRWPTPSDGSFQCTQHSHVSDSQINKEEELEMVELKLEEMGYTRPFPAPAPAEFEDTFPLPEHTHDAKAIQEEKAMLEAVKDSVWSVTGKRRREGRGFEYLAKEARGATEAYLDFLEQIHSGKIKPVDAVSYRHEGNRLAGVRMHLLEAMAEESIRKRPKFDI